MTSLSAVHEALHRLDGERIATLRGRSLLLTAEWSGAEIETLLDVADAFHALDRAGIAAPLFPNELDYALFFDASTRTKSSWAGAAARLGSQPVIVDGSSTQVSHGETAEETGAMLGMNAHALGIRHDLILGEGNAFMRDAKRGIDDYLAATGDPRVVPIVNLQCDVDHPTQTLADLAWLRQRFPEGVAGKTLAMTWAYSPSYAKPLSVPQGLISLLPRFGMHVRLAHPPGYDLIPEVLATAFENAADAAGSLEVVEGMDAAFAGADAVYPKSWGPYDLMLERVEANRRRDVAGMREIEQRALARNLLHRDWICDERRMASTRDGAAVYLHCLPADIGAEVTAGVMDKARVELARQANKKVYVIMALLAVAKADRLQDRLRALLDR
ncbi:MAG: knotted carbamoyltransferase YgeW [Acidobacteriota bacterium]|nr:knotted carbamoyltransferase YgeW [Acidobacteriota bacterium]